MNGEDSNSLISKTGGNSQCSELNGSIIYWLAFHATDNNPVNDSYIETGTMLAEIFLASRF